MNNGQTTWTYNQGVVLGGLVNLYNITGNATLLDYAVRIANATLNILVYPDGSALSFRFFYVAGVLRETCEPNSCDSDQRQFKVNHVLHETTNILQGVFMRYLALLAACPDIDPEMADFFKSAIELNYVSSMTRNKNV